MLESLSKSTKKHYKTSLKAWAEFCEKSSYEVFETRPTHVIAFLTKRHQEGKSYSTLNTDKSAISIISDKDIGNDKRVCRFMKGCFNINPPQARYQSTWNVDTVFEYFEKAEDTSELSFKLLIYKTIMLLALATAQ